MVSLLSLPCAGGQQDTGVFPYVNRELGTCPLCRGRAGGRRENKSNTSAYWCKQAAKQPPSAWSCLLRYATQLLKKAHCPATEPNTRTRLRTQAKPNRAGNGQCPQLGFYYHRSYPDSLLSARRASQHLFPHPPTPRDCSLFTG